MAEAIATCVIAEDEALLRQALLDQLAQAWPQLQILAACEDGASALEALARHQPQVAFLDISMPGLNGLEVAAAAVQVSPGTQIVFVTAYDQHALDAFEHGAIDYLLKPISAERLAATVQRLQARTDRVDVGRLTALVEQLGKQLPRIGAPEPLTWITASAGRETRLIPIEDVAYFRADHKYTTVMTADGEALLRTPIRELLALLDPATFKQIHRSTIVNLTAIAGIVRDDSGRGIVRLKSRPETLTVSVTYMALFRQM
ncbi:LytR/AlgR family response regulator transcription factor [Rhodanobacter ginsengiterrae]|uniref:LytR/AlgR family response regulator transcription factor n=1 Tax=Rhodanobacter ginsengiterrae TaxID=2008451 RepID=UPI003CEA5A17